MNLPLSCTKKVTTVLLLLWAMLAITALPLSAQTTPSGATTRQISGVVTDDKGEPLIGANVILKEATSVGVITDFEGRFSMNAPARGTLQISYIGYHSQEISISGKDHFTVKLMEDSNTLDDVVVVGYGVMKKSDVISSVTTIKTDKMTKSATLDVAEMLRGKAAGLKITTSDNAGPGGKADIQIRGVNSISGGTSPIVVADGVVIGSINDVNPNDIASVEILKDAAAQAIYGARAANGVILLTTKRGETGKARVSYQGYYGIQNVDRNFDTYSPEEFIQYKREAYRTTNNNQYGADTDVFSQLELESIQNGQFIDWQKELMRTGTIQNHDITVTAGSERTKIFVSGNFMRQTGVVPATDFTKGQLRFNLDQDLTSWLKVGLNTSMSISTTNDPGVTGLLRDAVTCSPLGSVYDAEGNLNMHPTGLQENWNPLIDIQEKTVEKKNRNDLVSLFLDFKIFKGLNFRVNASRRSWNYKGETYNTAKSKAGNGTGMGSGSVKNEDVNEWTIDNILSYDNQFGKHHVSGTLIQSWNERNEHMNMIEGSLIPNDLLGVYGIEAAEKVIPTLSASQRRLISTALRVQYDFASRYYVTVSGRRDGSSVFGAQNKWAVFPAMALGWNVYQEEFMQKFEQVSNLKLRGSYGSVGNEAIAPYGSIASANQWDYYTNKKLTGYTPGAVLSNPKLKWETSTTLNLAVDFGFFNNRLSGTVEWYNTRTKDLLVDRSISSATGYSTIKDNIGEIQNRGLEVMLEGVLVRNHDWDVQVGFTYSRNRNKILKLFGDLDGDGKEDDYPINNWFIGKPISVAKIYEVAGIWQEDEIDEIAKSAQPNAQPGDIKIVDRTEDGKLDDDDKMIVSQFPKWNGSFNLSARYKNIDFSMDIYTVQGITKYNPFLAEYNYGGNMRAVFNGIKVNYWTPENPTGNFPRPTTNGALEMGHIARQDASYVRLQNLTVGYTLPKVWTAKAHLSNVRVYFTGQNLLTFTDYESYSPEQQADKYPETRTLTVGLQVGF
ncbi:TonB-dependent receptor [Bacteroides sp. 51]|uniref:SusC/RagA family TonB-linked outer membrane protein n=1 Tax=Bacteroides sp. 51 TaxID=2302938 RepID=UPI0013D0F1FC|nr:TonB-dependent receptor [Bacteroides sp. 51]NDV80474.1 TonB-dependent receptor [Bacteroides sp. 51]